jgi:hypothetical protein
VRREGIQGSGEQPDLVLFPHSVGVLEVVIRAVPRIGAVSIGGGGGKEDVGRDGAAIWSAGSRDWLYGGTGNEESKRGERRGHHKQQNERMAATSEK